ncbi:MAG TPA: isoprenylcysteine carboxylmethyltransferase family protein [Candidatus Marinimicrobia bacterium]|nr:isoprenylcysteine carboxylmethyltransferase family protein [Candidatus Neomarinimicrobiota bacterium]HRS52371.1 isoprenylcysteine carboxylmethyltransferase family protein [Candidatus Neomarinimicrobiota bacterium]HRU92980.1 isoprenylcysteine carboxylmethyltransferase family protein [Candidatus Neomarinimicrobiota bacterium]
MDIRRQFFKMRGYTPLPLVLVLIYQSDMNFKLAIIGAVLALIGEGIRLNGVRAAGGRTRTRNVGAKELCTWGIFAHMRNPLYIGNALIYFGMVLFAGGRWLLPLMLILFVYVLIQYGLIISLEEETLMNIFGSEYEKYKANVPRLWPHLKPWNSGAEPKFLSNRKLLRTERSTLLVFVIFALAVILKEWLNVHW